LFGHEALLRSSHSSLTGPLEVLAAVERHHLIGELADVVVDRARTWLDSSPGDQMLFLNLHPGELADPDALGDRLQRLSKHSGRVILEITERSSIYGVSAWEQSLEVIRGLGLEIAVDDLGAGYSALSILAELKPRFIKLDMSIVRDADRLSHKQRLIDLLCRFADATDSLLVAEGIETEAEAATVRECGAHLLQGYLIGRPRLPPALRVVASEDEGQRDAG
jgi:EAL domain-containing protein (putative c-di-GMP-specific phosphodiesterase class I)